MEDDAFENALIYIIVVIVIVAVFLLGVITAYTLNIAKGGTSNINENNINEETDITNIIVEETPEVPDIDYMIISKVAQDVANSHEYILHTYDCTEFSKELVRRLNILGYKSMCLAGNNWNMEYTNHTWVRTIVNNREIEIEATSGFIINNPKASGYTIWRENYCW